jgi:hypothetical protein
MRPSELSATIASVAFWDFAMTEGNNFLADFQTVVRITHRLARPLQFQSVIGELLLFLHSKSRESNDGL